MKCVRMHRLVKTYFGNYKNFIAWCAAVALAVFTIDSLITPRLAHPKTRNMKMDPFETSLRTIAEAFDDPEQVRGQDKMAQEKPLPPQKSLVHAAHCGLAIECPRGKYSYYIRSGYSRDSSATMCFNDNYIVAEDKVSSDRGLNMIVINDATLNVEEIKVFDVYTSDASLISYLQNNIKDSHIIFVTSHDEASFNLSSVARKEFHKFGSSVLDRVNFRDNYALIGQKGIALGNAIEGHQARQEDMQFAESVAISGCMRIPVGKFKDQEQDAKNSVGKEQNDLKVPENKKPVERKAAEDADKLPEIKKPVEKEERKPAEKVQQKGKAKDKNPDGKAEAEKKGKVVKLGEEQLNCGVKTDCADEGFSVHLYTGFQARELPKICVNGNYILSTGLNDAGRGLNFVVVDPKTKEVSRVARFDTYSTDDNAIELFLEMLNEGDIILGVAHDEASMKLDKGARELIESLGSSFINHLSFRDVWAFVGQKGIVGFSPFEEFEFSDANSKSQILTWPNSIDKRYCIPPTLKALPERKILLKNEARKNFCKRHDGYGDFCKKENIDQPLLPAPLVDKSLANDLIFTIPIIIVSGLEYNSLRRQLELLLANPGIRVKNIMVFFDEKFEEAGELAAVFNISSHKLESSIKYTELMEKALASMWNFFPKAEYAIVLEEEIFPSTDFLNFFRQCMPALREDNTLAGISAWNDNSYENHGGIKTLAYRAEMLPGIGLLLKKSFYQQQIKDRMTECCMKRSWEGWIREEMMEFEVIIPDVSRVERGQYTGRMTDLLKELFRRPREMTGYRGNQYKLTNADSLETGKYEADLEQTISTTRLLDKTQLQKCVTDANFIFPVTAIVKGPYAVYYEQDTKFDQKVLYLLCKCFSIFHVPGYRARGTHRGLIRLSYAGQMVFLIGSKTEYFKHKPNDVEVLRLPAKAR